MTTPNKFNKNRNDSKFPPVVESNRDMKEKEMFSGISAPKKVGRHGKAIYTASKGK